MSKYTFGFIGCGNMGGALAHAAARSIRADELAVCDCDKSKTDPFAQIGASVLTDAASVAADSRYIFLAVKPQVMGEMLSGIAPVLRARTDRYTLVSMAAGVSIADIESMAGVSCPIIRMMPNTPALVGEGMILYSANALTDKADIDGYLQGLSAAGNFDMIPESLIDAAGALSGCGPAFVYLFAEALADAAVECGVPRAKAQLYAAQTLRGASEMILRSGKHTGELKDAVCSPGGTTIAGVHALESGAFRGTVMNAVKAAYDKTLKLK